MRRGAVCDSRRARWQQRIQEGASKLEVKGGQFALLSIRCAQKSALTEDGDEQLMLNRGVDGTRDAAISLNE